jgi:hypothetical protein
MYRFPAHLSLVAVALAALTSCAAPTNGFSKVKITRVNAASRLRSVDQSINFEQRHFLHGALTSQEIRERSGNYYTAFWNVADDSQPVTVRFEYRQAKTGSKVLVKEESVTPSGSNTTQFRIVGTDYQTDEEKNPVTAWRLSLVRGSEVIATKKSYLWE